MSWYTNYMNRMNANGVTTRERDINDQKQAILNDFTNSPSYQEVYINDDVDVTGVWIVDNSNVKDTKNIISQANDPINAGDIITWNGIKWIIVNKDDMTDVYHKGNMARCSSSIKWVDSSNITLEAWYTYRNTMLSNFGIDESKAISTGNERRHIIIQSNADTLLIDKTFRFSIDRRSWKVTAVDRVMIPGLIYLVLEEDTISNVDNIDTGIAPKQESEEGGMW